jgi:hypothetical protein
MTGKHSQQGNPIRGLVIAVLIVIGLFILFCGFDPLGIGWEW